MMGQCVKCGNPTDQLICESCATSWKNHSADLQTFQEGTNQLREDWINAGRPLWTTTELRSRLLEAFGVDVDRLNVPEIILQRQLDFIMSDQS